ncbi:unnamed protein product [Effrenium voratum]|uniref:PDZ domain-containing protein n=1 Tax=Effrenium voratum TaxID=2562239 RepID=A0AA36NF90_9DINO|nr:unnamed protein product [Effrenium voratum]
MLRWVLAYTSCSIAWAAHADFLCAASAWEDCSAGVQLVQSMSEKRRQAAPSKGLPYASLVESAADESISEKEDATLSQMKQAFLHWQQLTGSKFGQVVGLAQSRVQTKVGEAPYFIIAIAIGGFVLSLVSICVSLIFVSKRVQDRGDGVPNASALLAQQLRAIGVGQPKKSWPVWQQHQLQAQAQNLEMERAKLGAAPPRNRVQIVVHEPLEGGKLGLNLSEDDLVINNFGDLRACDFGFQIGDRIVQVNQIPVFKEADFRFIMQDALRQHDQLGEPIVFEVARGPESAASAPQVSPYVGAASSFPTAATTPEMRTMLPAEPDQDITGAWAYGGGEANRHMYTIRRAGNSLCFEQELPDGEKVSGVLTPEEASPWLRTELQGTGGLHGELRVHYDPEDQVLVSQVRPMGHKKWGNERLATRAQGKA